MAPLAAIHPWLQPDLDKTSEDGGLSLADLQVTERGRVRELCCGALATNRLVSLGFTPGAEVDMTQNYGRGPIIVTVRGGSVALGRGEALHILVERLSS